jgi:hypothetical protein
MSTRQTYFVLSSFPRRKKCRQMAYLRRWCWGDDIRQLYRRAGPRTALRQRRKARADAVRAMAAVSRAEHRKRLNHIRPFGPTVW